MTVSQIVILSVLGCFSLISLGVLARLILSNTTSLSNIQPTPVPQRPTAAQQRPTAVVDNYLVGVWLDNWVGPCTITIKKINGSYQMTRLYRDGSGETKILIVQTVGSTERLIEYPDSPAGDYMVIENGNLVFYDNQGFIYQDYPK
jgi:hypothetical protein